MSFKRDGDDREALAVLKKRRVADLLGEDVPVDEVSRLSNGRLTCLVCSHRPIFDTLSMLYVHRKGKRHLASVAYQDQKQRELRALVDKRAHEEFVRTGATTLHQAQRLATSHHGLGLGAPYDPRVKKRKPFDRKSRLDLHGTDGAAIPTPGTSTQSHVATDSKWLPGNKVDSGDRDYKDTKIRIDRTVGDKASLRNHDNRKKDFSSKKPMVNYLNDSGPDINHSNMKKVVMGNDNVSKYYLARRKQSQQTHTASTLGNSNSVTSSDRHTIIETSQSPAGLHNTWDKFKTMKKTFSSESVNVSAEVKKRDHITIATVSDMKKTLEPMSDESATCTLQPSDESATRVSQPPEPDMERVQKLRLLAGSGWKKDWDGQWIQDEDAEFDSDEEPPDIT